MIFFLMKTDNKHSSKDEINWNHDKFETVLRSPTNV